MNIETLMYIFLDIDLMEKGGTMTFFYQNNTQQVWVSLSCCCVTDIHV